MTPSYVYALLSKDVYKSKNTPLSCELKGRSWQRYELPPKIKSQFAAGFYGRIYWSERRNEVVIAFRGTDWSESENKWQNYDILIRKQKGRYHESAKKLVEYAREIVSTFNLRSNYRLTLTGHSLGGMMAMILAAENPKLRAIVFDAPGVGGVDGAPVTELHDVFERRIVCDGVPINRASAVFLASRMNCHESAGPFKKAFKKVYSNIHNIIVEGSVISKLGTHVGHVSVLKITPPGCKMDKDMATYFLTTPTRPGEYAAYMASRAVNCVVIELHQITHIVEGLRNQLIEVAV